MSNRRKRPIGKEGEEEPTSKQQQISAEHKELQLLQTRLTSTFFDRPCLDVAKSLLGCLIIRNVNVDGTDVELRARIVETEAYLGGEDKASHSYNGKKTARNAAMYMAAGTAYVYNIYGMYCCLNISTKEGGSAVLIRAAEPLCGMDIMTKYRTKKGEGGKSVTGLQLVNGPSKLCQALCISKDLFDQYDLTRPDQSQFYIATDEYKIDSSNIECKPRIGIGNYAEDWTDKPLRFYISDSKFVSVKNKK